MASKFIGFRRHQVLITRPLHPELGDWLDRYFDVVARNCDTPVNETEMRALLADKSAVILDQDDEFPVWEKGLAPLVAVCSMSTDVDNLHVPALTRAGIIATHVRDATASDITSKEVEPNRWRMKRAAENLVAAFGFGRLGGRPPDLLNHELACDGCCL